MTTKSESYMLYKNNSNLLNKETENILIENAEDEVVSIILSAIMGNIIEMWEVSSDNRWSDVCVECKSIERNLNIGCSHIKHESVEEQTASHRSTSFSELSQYLLSKKRTSISGSTIEQQTKQSANAEGILIDGTTRSFESNNNSVSKSQESDESRVHNTVQETEIENKKSSFKSHFENLRNKIYGWLLLNTGLEVSIKFMNGNRYEGKLLRCRMHGIGKFFWADGSTYEGDFQHGEMSGEGCMEWQDQSWYEGQIQCGYRHGLGLFVQRPYFYCGHWRCTMRDGSGSMFYNRHNVQRDYYSGEWVRGRKQGPGVRSYPSGAMYSGQWESGLRHGLGTMVWTNNDVYSGNWKIGQIQGYGEYTWATFVNKQFVVPQENCYYGNWEEGRRNGNGTLETNLGVIVRGTWKDGKKHGAAEVICSNGCCVYAENLFVDDCISHVAELTDKDSPLDTTVQSYQLYKVPVNAANHDIELGFYVSQLNEYIFECKRLGKPFNKSTARSKFCNDSLSSQRNKGCEKSPIKSCKYEYSDESFVGNELEENLIRNTIKQYLSVLNVVYTKYSKICCEKKPHFNPVMMRLMFWQLLRDCKLNERGYSLSDFNILIANNKASLVQSVHYPFERLQFWQFLHCLIEISWQLYGRQLNGTNYISGVLASAFHKLITVDILPNAGRHTGSALFKHKNLLSLDSVYWFYRGMGEPLSARKLLKSIFTPEDKSSSHHNCEYPHHLLYGRNVIGVGGKLTYSPDDEPFLLHSKFTADPDHPHDLTCLNTIGLPAVFDCIVDICPSISYDGLVVNMDYQVVFLEFYEILLLCARLKVQKNHPPTPQESEILENSPGNESTQIRKELVGETSSLSTGKNTKGNKTPKEKKKKAEFKT